MNRIAIAVIVGLSLLCGLVGYELAASRAHEEALDRQLAGLRVESARMQRHRDSLDAAFHVQNTIRTVTLRQYDSVRIRDTIAVSRVDTVHHDTTVTVYVPRAVADTAIRACTLALRTCEQRVATADSLTALARQQTALTADALTAARRTGRWTAAGWALAGLVVGRAIR